ncbi:MAG: YIP1 family protein [Candidatus Micrarchaeia archaeon]|jgi:hypothetical protein
MNLQETIAIWNGALFSPKTTFETIKPKSNLKTALAWAAGVGLLLFLMITATLLLTAPQDVADSVSLLRGTVMAALAFPLSLLVYSSLFFIFAKLLGGQGSFGENTFVISSYLIPLTAVWLVLSNLLSAIATLFTADFALLNSCVSVLYALYGLYLLILAIRAVHGFSFARAVATIALPFVILLVILFSLDSLIVYFTSQLSSVHG